MAKLDEPRRFARGEDVQADADRYDPAGALIGGKSGANYGGYCAQVDAYARKTPKLGAGGPHNRPARGHESET